MNILIVEDNQTQNDVLANFLRHEYYDVVSAYTLREARELFSSDTNLIVLDVMLPDGSGLDFLKEIRKYSDVPVIVLTALDDEYTQVSTFDLKADEYVDKPVSPIVMTKRITALLERIYGNSDSVNIMGFIFDFKKFISYSSDEKDLKLTTKETQIIKCLYDANGNVVTRDNILNSVWGYEYIGEDRLIDTHIKNIRKKTSPEIILTVKGVGYRLNI
jgi:YD repeat-containing protein